MHKSIEIIEDYLALFPFLKEMDKDSLIKFASLCHGQIAEKGTFLYRQGEQKQCIYFLCSGKVKFFKIDKKGKELIVSFKTKGAIFPLLSFTNQQEEHLMNALIIEKATFICLPINKLKRHLHRFPQFIHFLLRNVGEELLDLQNRLEDKLLNSTEEQVINLLLRLAENHAVTLSNQKLLFLTSFQIKDLANMIGLSRETTGRVLTKLTLNKFIERDEHGRLLLNPTLLKRDNSD